MAGLIQPLRVNNSLRVVVAVPCFNTANSISDVIRKTKQYVEEVVVIDDGSTDMTAEVARAAGATVICHKKNKGKGAAIKTAISKVDADVIIFIDGDGKEIFRHEGFFPKEEILPILAQMGVN